MSRGIARPSVALATAAAITLSTPVIASADTVAPRLNYQVRSGDTLAKISRTTGVPVQSIAQVNNLPADGAMRPGQRLLIPSGSGLRTATRAMTHVVKSGETVSGIAQKYDTTITQIVKLNKLANANRIYVGQKLVVKAGTNSAVAKPATSTTKAVAKSTTAAMTYTVKSGDTLSGIAAKSGTTVSALAKLNNIKNPGLIYTGQLIKLSVATSSPVQKPVAKTTPKTATGSVYTVKSGDSLSVIARRYNTTVSAIASANNISNPSRIYVGQKLTIGGTAKTLTASSSTSQNLVQNNFPGYTYPDATVAAANKNKNSLVNSSIPSRAQMQQKVRQTAIEMGVNPKLALAHAYVESGFDMTAVSPANAIGVMQVIPSSGEWASQMVGRKLNLLDPDDNVTAGVAIIRYLQRNASSFDQGIAGYYQGLGGVQKYGMRSDTVNYVAKVKNAMASF